MTSSIDQQFIEFVVKSLVNNPDDVSIERSVDEKGVLLELTVNPEDLGRVIGKRGATAQSLRTLLRALGTKNDARYNLKIVDNGEPYQPREDRAPASSTGSRSSSDDKPADDQKENDEDEAQEEKTEPTKDANEEPKEEIDHSDAVRKARAELADLDDLDI